MSDPVSDSARIDFLARFLADREAGAARPLDHYLALFPGARAAIASEFESLAAPVDEHAGVERSSDRARIGPYRLLRELGRGGQGAVWLAEDERLARKVALKIVPRGPWAEGASARFQREARAASRIVHPGLCAVYDVGSDERCAWIAMRFVEGETFANWIAARAAKGERPEPLHVARWIEAVARALHAAHEAGVVHRDVKPANVMLPPDGEPVVLDFGVARESDEAAPLTMTGDALGTPAYMSPEQLGGERAFVDRRTDVWSLGATLYEALTSKRPFEAPTREALIRGILETDPPDPRSFEARIPRDLAVVVATALEKELSRRYQTALDLAEDLRRVREREPIRARPAGPMLRLRRWRERNPTLAVSLAALAIVLVAGLAATSALLVRSQRTLREKAALLGDVAQLSDRQVTRELLAEKERLWPASEAMLARMDDWRSRAAGVIDRRERYEDARTAIAARTDFDPDPARNAEARVWLLGQLEELLASLDALEMANSEVDARREFAATVRRRSIDEHAAAWSRAIAAVADDPRFGGLALAPQVGLVPLGPDRASGLEEFAHLETGVGPVRDETTGRLAIGPETGLVFVLIPPAETFIGSELPSELRPAGTPFVDRWTARWDGPPLAVKLDAYFISKYEMTQGQWMRHAGVNPSAYRSPSRWIVPEESRSHPVEQASWEMATSELAEMSLALPTEAQWERAGRGGTTTPWFTGSEPESLGGFANLADRHAKDDGGSDTWAYELWLDDGFTIHAPVGSLAANPFGLHDVAGNVSEWCRETWEDLAQAQPRQGDGFVAGEQNAYVIRGGSFAVNAVRARSAQRGGFLPNATAPDVGVRPVRAIER